MAAGPHQSSLHERRAGNATPEKDGLLATMPITRAGMVPMATYRSARRDHQMAGVLIRSECKCVA